MIVLIKNLKSNWIDTHLRFVLASLFKKKPSEITKDFLKTLKEIDLSDSGIIDLEGIQYATNLNTLNLSKNEIFDASLLSELNELRNLELSENKIEDITFLSKLKNIKSVGLDSNNISFVSEINNLNNLVLINLSNNNIKDLSFISTLHSKNVKVIASEQCVILNPISINYGDDYLFESPIYWNNETKVSLDNIQVKGIYDYVKTNKRPSFLYSISKIIIKNIHSECILKADFYHEVSFLKSGILSGVLIQPINIKFTCSQFNILKINKENTLGSIYGKIEIESTTQDVFENELFLKNNLLTMINADGEKISCLTNKKGQYKFSNLKKGRYTILFPFLAKFKYVTPSLHICNLKEGENLAVNSTLIKK